jgi:hypothetical protein
MTKEELDRLIAAGQKAKAAKMEKRNCSLSISREEGLYIAYRMKCAGMTCASVGRSLGCKRQVVQRVVTGLMHSKRIETEIARSLGYRAWNDMVKNIRAAQSAVA